MLRCSEIGGKKAGKRLDGRLDDLRPGTPRTINDAVGVYSRLRLRLTCNPRFHVHFTPTSASWLDQVERWFATLTERQIRPGTHRGTVELEYAIRETRAVHNRDPTSASGHWILIETSVAMTFEDHVPSHRALPSRRSLDGKPPTDGTSGLEPASTSAMVLLGRTAAPEPAVEYL